MITKSLLTLVVGVVMSMLLQPANAPSDSADADRLAGQVMKASGGDVWGRVTRIKFSFNVERDGVTYSNDGDWVESCTALVERADGELELLTWHTQAALAPVAQPLRDAA